MPLSLSRAFTESQAFATRVNEYHDGTSQRSTMLDSPRRSWQLTKRLTAEDLTELREFWQEHGAGVFWFYNPKETSPPFSYDPTGAATAGRYRVRFANAWSQSAGVGRLDASVELVELFRGAFLRTGFKHERLKEYVLHRRRELLIALLTIARAWFAAGQPKASTPLVGSFERWTEVIAGILQHAQVDGFLTNSDRLFEQSDVERSDWETFVEVTEDAFPGMAFSVAEFWERLNEKSYEELIRQSVLTDRAEELRNALPADLTRWMDREGPFKQRLGVAFNFGYGPFTTFPLSHHSEPFMPGDRTCNGGAYTFQIPGALAVADTVAIPMRVQDSASIRCIYAYVQTPTTDGQSAYLVKVSRDDGATWESLEYMGIAQMLPDGAKNTYDFLLAEGYGKPATRRLPYNDFGVILAQNVTHGGSAQTVNIASYGANHMSFDVGEFAHVNLGEADEEYVEVLAADPVAQTFNAVFTKDHSIGATVRPTIWPTQILYEGDTLAFDILAVASPDPGSDLTVVIQT